MITAIKGKRYNFEIISRNNKSQYDFFYIRAKHKATGRTSCINNLNVILSELGVNSNKPQYADSMWEIPRNQTSRFISISRKIISDSVFTAYLEKRLDKDRTLGEWENIKKMSWV